MVERLVKPKNARAKRALLKRAPRQVETLKRALLLHSGRTSAVMKSVLSDLGALKAGESLKLTRKNEGVRPFEGGGEASLEFLTRKADCSLFALASHSKKRPNNLVLGRTFDARLLDMVEFGVRARCARARGAGAAARGAAPPRAHFSPGG
jgi:ribosome production factor 2